MTAGSGHDVRVAEGVRPIARLRGLRYVPLVMLVVIAIVLTIVGFVTQRQLQAGWDAETAPVALPDEVAPSTLAASCTPASRAATRSRASRTRGTSGSPPPSRPGSRRTPWTRDASCSRR